MKHLLDAYRRRTGMPAANRERVRVALAEAIRDGVGPSAWAEAAASSGRVSPWTIVGLVVVTTIVATVLVRQGERPRLEAPVSEVRAAVTERERVTEPPPAREATEPAVTEVADPVVVPATPQPPTRAPDRFTKPKKPSDERSSSLRLARELQLVDEAQAALGRGQPGRALEILDTHRREFPRGALAIERSILEIEASCAAGRHERGRALADRFMHRHPESPHAGRVRRACPD